MRNTLVAAFLTFSASLSLFISNPVKPTPDGIFIIETKPLVGAIQSDIKTLDTIEPYVIADTPKPSTGTINCGDNVYKQYIYQHESGCNTAAVNWIGCTGIGQSCPASKIAYCGTDFACQDAWFSNYAVSRYGSWEGAYNWWKIHSWW